MTNSNPPHTPSPASRAAAVADGHRRQFPKPEDWEARRKRYAERDARWLEKRRLTCEPYAEADAILAHRGTMLAAWSMMRDASGEEIERHLATLAEPYVERLVAAAWDLDGEGEPRRTWTSWSARAIAVVAWFLAVSCRATEYHGRTAWRVVGFSMRFFGMLCAQHVQRGDTEVRVMPGRSTFGHVSRKKGGPPGPPRGWMGALVRVGLLEAQQFDADKVRPSERGKRRWNPRTGRWEQWAYNQWFLLVCPFEAGETRPKALGKARRNKLVVRRVTDSLLHRQRRNRKRRAEEAAALERARLESEVGGGGDPSPIFQTINPTPSMPPAPPVPSSPAPSSSLASRAAAAAAQFLEAARRRGLGSTEPPD